MAEKTRYSDEELEEFRQIINDKLALARRELSIMMGQLNNSDNNGVDDTSPTYKALEEGKRLTVERRDCTDGRPSAEVHSGT